MTFPDIPYPYPPPPPKKRNDEKRRQRHIPSRGELLEHFGYTRRFLWQKKLDEIHRKEMRDLE